MIGPVDSERTRRAKSLTLPFETERSLSKTPVATRGSGLSACVPCSFGLLPHPRSGTSRPAQRPPSIDRDCPLDTARDRCLWHAGGTAGEDDDASPDGDGSSSARGGDPAPVTTDSQP